MAAGSDAGLIVVQNHPVAAARQNHAAEAHNPEAAHSQTQDQWDDKAAQVVARNLAEIRVAFARPADNQRALVAGKLAVAVRFGAAAGMPERWAAHHRQAAAALATIEVEPAAGFEAPQVTAMPGAMAQEPKLQRPSPHLLPQK